MYPVELALEFLKEGRSARIGDLGLGSNHDGLFEVSGWSNYRMVKFLTKRIALQELSEVKELFKKVLVELPELKDIIGSKTIQFQLLLDDAGKFSEILLTETDNELEWYGTLKG